MARNSLNFRHIRVVGNLHPRLSDAGGGWGFTLVEVLVALTVLGVAAAGVVTIGGAGRRMGEAAALRSAQVIAARETLGSAAHRGPGSESDTVHVGARRLAVGIDAAWIAPGILELTVRVEGSGPVGAYEVVTRRAVAGP